MLVPVARACIKQFCQKLIEWTVWRHNKIYKNKKRDLRKNSKKKRFKQMDFIDYVCYILLFLAIGGILGTALLDP